MSSASVSEPHTTPYSTRCVASASTATLGADHIGFEVGLAASTVQNILNRAGVGRLDRGDRATSGEPVRRYQRDTAGELIHVDIKKLAAIPDGGGWKTRGRGYSGECARSRTAGYRYIHTAIDDRTRIAYSEICDNEQAATAAGFWRRAAAWYISIGIQPGAGTHRQWCLLPLRAMAQGLRRNRNHRQKDTATPTPNQRQSRTVPPHPPRGMGLHPPMDIRTPTPHRLQRVHPLLQSPQIPRITRMGNTSQHPQRQPPPRAQLDVARPCLLH